MRVFPFPKLSSKPCQQVAVFPGGLGSHRLRRKQRVLRSASTSQRPGCGNCFRSGKGCGRDRRKLRLVISKISVSETPPVGSQNKHSEQTHISHPRRADRMLAPKAHCRLEPLTTCPFWQATSHRTMPPLLPPVYAPLPHPGTHTQSRRLYFSFCRSVLSNALWSCASLGFLCSQ